MADRENFDLLEAPLEGTHLIEASAGTGKTYAISGLFLRLLLEKNLSVSEILVVTFTEAATEELKERIRSKLLEAIRAFSGGASGDPFLQDLAKKLKDSGLAGTDSQTALRCLREAMRAFDQAAILTIHGFCSRMLHENVFEVGSLFDTELIADQENIKKEIVDDFWRKRFYHASSLFVNYALENNCTPDSLLSLLGNRIAQPHLKIIPQVEIPEASEQEDGFRESFNQVSSAWPSARGEVQEILATCKGLNRNKYRKTRIPAWVQGMDDYLASGGNKPSLFKGFEKFTSNEIAGAMKKNDSPPTHPFFDLCETLRERERELKAVFAEQLMGLRVKLFRYVRDALAARQEEKNIQSFDDLLLKLHQALEKPDGAKLSRVIRMKFRAALIDEFQDTDPIQYAIFKTLFGNGDIPLFLIGDPKQAIYSFRGADLFTYMNAAGDVETRHTLGDNWRSEPDLVSAVNSIFASAERPFLYEGIPFQPAVPAIDKPPEFALEKGQSHPPLQLWFLNAGKITGSEKAVTKTVAREVISRAVAREISRLLSLGRDNNALAGRNPVTESDIAILVRTNAEGLLVQEALTDQKIPSVLYSTGNLFDSHEALEVERVLSGIADPKNEKALKAVLTTDIMGIRGEDLQRLMFDGPGMEEWLVKFRNYHDLWNEHGFIRMFRHFMSEEAVLPRLMSFPDGERRNTNLLHLSEVLHQVTIERKLRGVGLVKWLSQQRNPNTQRLEEHQIRLESDENAVKVVTVHKSKGLEYPVVFCPFVWNGSRVAKEKNLFTFHDKTDKMRLTLDLGSPEVDKNRRVAEEELLAENIRLFYVALTRAKSRCYFVWGRVNLAGTSPPAYLLHQSGSVEGKNIVDATEETFQGLSDEDVFGQLTSVQEKSGGTIELSEMPLEAEEDRPALPVRKEPLNCRKFSGKIDRQWRISSFSSLISGQPHSAEPTDYDDAKLSRPYDKKRLEKIMVGEPSPGILAFPRGAKAGIFFHDVFEHLDFTEEEPAPTKRMVADKLKEYGFEATWQEPLLDMIQKVRSVPLDPDIENFSLSRIPNRDRRNELEFYFPLKPISPKQLGRLFSGSAGHKISGDFPQRIERLDFLPVKGFMRGFMDMVFQFDGRYYLVDWKSNFLGDRVEDYGQEALSAVMEDAFYVFQYHIYTVALNQYLQLRLQDYNYEKHFGGVYYVFLRGVDPDRGMDFGIYRDRPCDRLIREWRTTLIQDNL